MSIKDDYVSIFKKIRRRYGEERSTCQVSPDDSLKKVIGYTRNYVIEHREPHFRYNYYNNALSRALKCLNFKPGSRLVHFDIGCGPGLFAWVIHDYMESLFPLGSVDCYGYDHSPEMIRLARLFFDAFPAEYDFKGFHDKVDILQVLVTRDFSECDVVVTFGHVLVQVQAHPVAIGDFRELISCLFPLRSCVLVAVDAYSGGKTREIFQNQCSALRAALEEAGVQCANWVRTPTRSIWFARLHERGENGR